MYRQETYIIDHKSVNIILFRYLNNEKANGIQKETSSSQ